MRAGEIKVIKDFVDNDLKLLIDTELERLPGTYGVAAKAIVDALIPAIVTYLDGKLAALPVDAAE